MTKKPPIVLQLSDAMLMGLLKGHECYFEILGGSSIIIKSSIDGVFLTHDQLNQIKYNSEMGIIDLIEKLQKPIKGKGQ